MAIRGRKAEGLRLALDGRHPEGMTQDDAGPARRSQQRVQHRTRAVGDGKELPGLLPLELHPELTEERDRARDIEAAEDFADGGRGRSVEGGLVDRVVRDVAASAAG